MTAEISRAVRAACRPLREQRDAWHRAALGVLALAVTGNVGLYSLVLSQEARHREETEQLCAKLQHAEMVRDSALEELGRLANQTALEAQARQAQAEAYEAVGAYRYIGRCTVTAYCPCAECCGRWADGTTATGLPAGPGIVAVDPEVIPLGSTVVIDGLKYLAADTGSGVTGYHIDVCMASHGETVAHGVQAADVWIIPQESNRT